MFLTVSSVFLVCLLTDLEGARHNGTPKPLRGRAQRDKRGKRKNKAEGGGKSGQKRRRRNRRRREDCCPAPGEQKSFSSEEWAERVREGGRFEKRDLLYLSGVHAPPSVPPSHLDILLFIFLSASATSRQKVKNAQ